MANCLSINDLRKLKISKNELIKTDVKLTSYTKNVLPVIGKIYLNCNYKERNCMLDFFVIDSDTNSLLGLNACKKLNLVQKIDSIDKSTEFGFWRV